MPETEEQIRERNQRIFLNVQEIAEIKSKIIRIVRILGLLVEHDIADSSTDKADYILKADYELKQLKKE